MASKKAIAEMLMAFGENWPTRVVTAETAQIYEQALSDVPDWALERATLVCLRECRFWPSAAEVREMAARHAPAWDTLEQARALSEAKWVQVMPGVCLVGSGLALREALNEWRRATEADARGEPVSEG